MVDTNNTTANIPSAPSAVKQQTQEEDITKNNPGASSRNKMIRSINLKARKKPGRGDINDPEFVIGALSNSWEDWQNAIKELSEEEKGAI